MRLFVRLTPEATGDIFSAQTWFEQHGLSEAFNLSLRNTVELLRDFPEAAPKIRREIRRIKLLEKRFPYHVYYLLDTKRLLFWQCYMCDEIPRFGTNVLVLIKI